MKWKNTAIRGKSEMFQVEEVLVLRYDAAPLEILLDLQHRLERRRMVDHFQMAVILTVAAQPLPALPATRDVLEFWSVPAGQISQISKHDLRDGFCQTGRQQVEMQTTSRAWPCPLAPDGIHDGCILRQQCIEVRLAANDANSRFRNVPVRHPKCRLAELLQRPGGGQDISHSVLECRAVTSFGWSHLQFCADLHRG